MSLYGRLLRNPDGARALSVSRLKYQVLQVLHTALRTSRKNQADIATSLGVRKSAVNQVLHGDGNVKIATLADYLYAMGFELECRLVPVGKQREDAVREMNQALVRRTVVPVTNLNVAWKPIASETQLEAVRTPRRRKSDVRAVESAGQ
jgi:predicted XRE-type DNA-binding protein